LSAPKQTGSADETTGQTAALGPEIAARLETVGSR